jgi:outer membrane protein OmpA-like peptidoglycan-associated protein
MRATRPFYAVLALGLLAGAAPVAAQRAPSGIGFAPSALVPHHRLGPGTIAGLGPELTLGVSPRLSVVGSLQEYRNVEADGRVYDLTTPTIEARASLIGHRSDLALLVGATAMRFEFEDRAPDVLIPALGAGLAVRMQLMGPIHGQLSARNWVSYVREGETGTVLREPGVAHSPDLRVGLSVLLRARQKSPAGHDLPIAHASDFRPVEAGSLTPEPERTTHGRDHTHSASGAALDPVTGLPLDGVEPAWSTRHMGSLYFDLGSDQIADSYRDMIEEIALLLRSDLRARVQLLGYTDRSGTPAVNLGLSESRGTAIRERLVRLYEIPAERIEVVAFGADHTARDEASARRVDVVVKEPAR